MVDSREKGIGEPDDCGISHSSIFGPLEQVAIEKQGTQNNVFVLVPAITDKESG